MQATASIKVRVAAIAVIVLLTLSAIALGFSAVTGADNSREPSSATAASSQDEGDNAVVSAFKFV